MKTGLLLSILLAVSLISGCASLTRKAKPTVQPGQTAQTFEKVITKTLSSGYLLYLPERYGKEDKQWPLILFLHGAGERGNDLELVKKHGPPKIVETKPDFPFVVVSPQCPSGMWWTELLDTLNALLDEIVGLYDIDEERIYLTGLSMGGFGTWDLAAAFPERFAAIAPICGGGTLRAGRSLRDMPTWVFHGAKDRVVPLDESERMVRILKSAGNNARFTVYPEAGHDSWTETYNNPELYEWFLQHQRQ